MSDETTTSERVGFCQDCGRPLTRETVRTVGTGVFCEPCLQVRLAGTSGAARTTPNAGYTQDMPLMPPKLPSPGLAALLSVIPGVGQVYNGQYAKGIAVLLICAMLDSFSKVNHFGFFGIAAFGLWIYQMVDAYQTARARLEGRPLPNPFELNDIGERLGFGKGFGVSADMRSYSAATAPPPVAGTNPVPPAPAANWAGYVPPAPPSAPYVAPVPPAPYSTPSSAAQIPYMPMPDVTVPQRGATFPLVAIWLIGLGLLFALGEWVPEIRINASSVVAIILGAVAASVIVRRLGYMGGFHYQGPALPMMRGPVILAVLAVLFLLQGVHAATLGQTWPVILLALGAVLLGERLGVGTQPYVPHHDAAPVSVVPPASTEAKQDSEGQDSGRDGFGR